jgi:hypothetical protein
VEEEEFGVACGGGAEVLVAGELCGGDGESLAKSHWSFIESPVIEFPVI